MSGSITRQATSRARSRANGSAMVGYGGRRATSSFGCGCRLIGCSSKMENILEPAPAQGVQDVDGALRRAGAARALSRRAHHVRPVAPADRVQRRHHRHGRQARCTAAWWSAPTIPPTAAASSSRLTRKGRDKLPCAWRGGTRSGSVSILGELSCRGAVGAAAEPDAAPSQPRPACEELTDGRCDDDAREPLDAGRFFAPGDRSVAIMLQAQAKKFGAKPLVQAGEQSWSFAEAPELAARSAGRLARPAWRQGDRVALICENRPEFIEIFLGAAWLGAILVPINTASRGLQLRHILENSGAKLMVIEAALLGALEHVDLATLPLETIWVIDSPSGAEGAADRTASAGVGRSRVLRRRRGRATRWPSSTRPAPLARRRACAARMRSSSGGASTRPICWASAATTSSARPCRCSTPIRSTPSSRR